MAESHPRGTSPARRDVGRMTADVGPYGVVGMAGNARSWCANPFLEGELPRRVDPHSPAGDPTWRAVRGGSWDSAARYCQLDARFVARPERQVGLVGVRLVRSLP